MAWCIFKVYYVRQFQIYAIFHVANNAKADHAQTAKPLLKRNMGQRNITKRARRRHRAKHEDDHASLIDRNEVLRKDTVLRQKMNVLRLCVVQQDICWITFLHMKFDLSFVIDQYILNMI